MITKMDEPTSNQEPINPNDPLGLREFSDGASVLLLEWFCVPVILAAQVIAYVRQYKAAAAMKATTRHR